MAPTSGTSTKSAPAEGARFWPKVALYLTFAAAMFVPYGLNLVVLVAAWALAIAMKPRDIPLAILLTALSLAGSAMWTFLPA